MAQSSTAEVACYIQTLIAGAEAELVIAGAEQGYSEED